MEELEETGRKEVFSGPHWEAALIRYMLQDKGIEAIIVDHNKAEIESNSIIPGTWEYSTVFIYKLDYEKAKVIVAEYEKSSQNNWIDGE